MILRWVWVSDAWGLCTIRFNACISWGVLSIVVKLGVITHTSPVLSCRWQCIILLISLQHCYFHFLPESPQMMWMILHLVPMIPPQNNPLPTRFAEIPPFFLIVAFCSCFMPYSFTFVGIRVLLFKQLLLLLLMRLVLVLMRRMQPLFLQLLPTLVCITRALLPVYAYST